MARDYELTAGLDASQILAQLKTISTNVERIADQGDKAFQGIGKGAQASGLQIGAVAGIVTSLTNKLIELGQRAVDVFADIIAGSVSLATGLETTEASLTGIFKGNEGVALAVLDRIQRKSLALGADLTEIAAAFLPRVKDIEQFERVAKLIPSLARIDPLAGVSGARRSLQEALVGDLVSLKKTFEIDTAPIAEAQKQFGNLEGLLIGLEGILKERGQDFEALEDTAAVAFGRGQEVLRQLQIALGEPILDTLKDEVNGLLGFFTEELPDGTVKIKDEFVLIATAIGEVVALIGDLAGDQLSGFLESLDTEKILDFVIKLGESIILVDSFADSLASIDTSGGIDEVGEFLFSIENLNNALRTANQLLAIIKLATAFDAVELGRMVATGDIRTWEDFVKLAEEETGAIGQMNESLEEGDERVQKLKETIEKLKEELAELKSIDPADAMLGDKQDAEAAAKALEEYETALDKVNKARGEFDTDKQRAFFDLQLKQQRALIDAEIEFSEKRQDIARKNTQAIQDIYRKHYQSIADAARDLTREEQDLARENTRDQADIALEEAREREQIESDHQRRLQDIKRRFEFDAQEAIRANDAIAFLRIQRQADFELETAETQRQRDVDDASIAAQEKREKLALELQREIEDANLANARKLEDLQINLAQALEAQQINYQRDLEQQAIAEQRKREELRLSYDRQLEDFNTYWARKLDDLQRQLQREFLLIQQHEARIAALQVNRRRGAIPTSEGRRVAPGVRGGGVRSGSPSDQIFDDPNFQSGGSIGANSSNFQSSGSIGQLHSGGRVKPGVPYLVGKAGAEEGFISSAPGYVYPEPLMMGNPQIQGGGVSNTRIDQRSQTFDFGKLGGLLSPSALAQVEQRTLEILGIIERDLA